MTRQDAEQLVTRLQGWDSPVIGETDWGAVYVTAVDPTDQRRKRYDESTGYFVTN